MDEVLHIADAAVAILLLLVGLPVAATGIAGLSAMLAAPLALSTTGPAKLLALPIFLLLLIVPLCNGVQKPARYSIRRLWPDRAVAEAAS